MWIANHYLVFCLDGRRVVVAPDQPIPAGITDVEIRILADGGAIRQAGKNLDDTSVAPSPEQAAKKPRTQKQESKK